MFGNYVLNADLNVNADLCSYLNNDLDACDLFVNAVSQDTKPLISVLVNNSELSMEFDSAATVSVCSDDVLKSAGIVGKLEPCYKKLRVANGQEQCVLGKMKVDVIAHGQVKTQLELFVVKGQFPTLCGRSWIQEFCAFL